MKNLIIWIITFVTFFAYTFPLLELSQNRAAKIVRTILQFVMCALLGFGTGTALGHVLYG